MNKTLKSSIWAILLSPQLMVAQAGYSSGSYGYSKETNQYAIIPEAKNVVVEEYFNYRRHALPLPQGDEKVHLDLRWAKSVADVNGDALLQVGITTPRMNTEKAPALNLCVVLDRSGSMAGDRIMHTRQATKELIMRLRPTDRLSVVLFDDKAEVLIPSQKVTDPKALSAIIDGAAERGSTDLNAGLQLGYQQVAKNYINDGSNKVIFLTDALANMGITDPNDILRQRGVYDRNLEIDFALIGVGADFNNDLSRLLTSKGHTIHFLSDSKDIQKVFIDELESLLSPIGRRVVLELEWDAALTMEHFYGYGHAVQQSGNQLRLPLNNMNCGLTQIALIDFNLLLGANTATVRARLVWDDAITQDNKTLNASATLGITSPAATPVEDADVLINQTIALLAQSIHDAAALFHGGSQSAASATLKKSLKMAKDRNLQNHADVKLVYDVVEGFKTNIEGWKP